MDIEAMIEWIFANIYLAIGIAVVSIFILVRIWRTMKMYIGNKRFVKKSVKLRRKKFNGPKLVEKITKKRKKNTNSFAKLRGRGKRFTKKYFIYKAEELPIITRYSHGKLFKRSNKKLLIVIKDEQKTLMKAKFKKGYKVLVKISNKYNCVDELILYLHNLPEAITEQEQYDVFLPEFSVSLGYEVK